MNIKRFLKDWSLPLSLVTGAVCYFFGRSLGLSTQARETILESINYIQPTLIFCMLALTFCRIRLQDMRLKGWQWWLLAFQAGVATLFCLLHETTEDSSSHVFLQSMMLLFLCPTATAAAVVTAKLDGNVGSLAAYTMLINLAAAVLISATSIPDLAFYLWLVSSSLAIAVTTRILVHAEVSWLLCLLILIGSLVACFMQFATGRLVGRRYEEAVTAGQACGQKNTVLAIWVGYTFLDPLTSVAGGFYTIWHNVFNAWQLYKRNQPRK